MLFKKGFIFINLNKLIVLFTPSYVGSVGTCKYGLSCLEIFSASMSWKTSLDLGIERAGDAGHEFLVFTDIDVAMHTSLLLSCLAVLTLN